MGGIVAGLFHDLFRNGKVKQRKTCCVENGDLIGACAALLRAEKNLTDLTGDMLARHIAALDGKLAFARVYALIDVVDVDDRVAQDRGIDLFFAGHIGADTAEMRAGFDPIARNKWLGGKGDGDDVLSD